MSKGEKITCIIFEMVGKEWEGGYWYVPQDQEEKFEYYMKSQFQTKKKGTYEFDVDYLDFMYNKKKIDENLFFYDATLVY